ncbi:MAG: hypothetical protein R3233_04025 [Xanthomonadales bacterium]|nr:hypothetical protein [Xanthomonadales bacterium]
MDKRFPLLRFLAGRLLAFLAAVSLAYLLAALTSTQAVILRLEGMGVTVPLDDRAAMALRDLGGLAGTFLPLVALGLLIALLCAALITRWLPRWRSALYFVAGAAALICVHLLMNLALGITPVAVARTGGGLAVQAAAGAAGGLAYLGLARRFARF